MRKILTVTAMIVGFAGVSRAEDNPGWLIGIGRADCASLLSMASKDHLRVSSDAEQWVAGFVSGFNVAQPPGKPYANGETIDLGGEPIWPRIEKYCKANVRSDLAVSAAQILNSLPNRDFNR